MPLHPITMIYFNVLQYDESKTFSRGQSAVFVLSGLGIFPTVFSSKEVIIVRVWRVARCAHIG
jgi:hypothetical protein